MLLRLADTVLILINMGPSNVKLFFKKVLPQHTFDIVWSFVKKMKSMHFMKMYKY